MAGGVYSFVDFLAAYTGSFGSFDMSSGGIAEEGITIAFDEDKASKVNGADGDWMHSLHASQGGTVTVRLLKTSPLNHTFSALYNYETSSSAYYGRGTITCRNPVTGDLFVCLGCGLRKFPDNVNAKDGGTNEWVFNVGRIEPTLGNGNPTLAG
jgi:hypothetical protein